MAYNIDRRAVSSIIFSGDIDPFVKARIREDFFRTKATRSAYSWIKRYYAKYGKVPSKELFKDQFPNFELLKSQDSQEFLIDGLIKRNVYRILVDSASKFGKELEVNQSKAIAIMSRGIEKARVNLNRSSDISLQEDALDVYVRHQNRKKYGRLSGIPFGFEPLDNNTDGMQAGQFGLVYGSSGLGKTWLVTKIGHSAFQNNAKVLHISPENTAVEIMNRYHAMQNGISAFKLRKGELTPYEQKKLKRNAVLTQRHGHRLIVSTQESILGDESSNMGTEGVRQKILQYRPHLCIVDGLYLLSDGEKQDWQSAINIAYRLKSIAMNKQWPCFILAVTQANNEDQIAFSKQVRSACDIVFYLHRTDDMKAAGYMGIKLQKQREGPEIDFTVEWDLDKCRFPVVDSETTNEECELPI